MKSQTLFLLLAASSALAQGNFQNLGFEDATYPLVPIFYGAQNFPVVLASDATPGWTPYLGADAGNALLYNTIFLGTAAVGIIDNSFGTNQALIPLDGFYSIILQAGFIGPGFVSAAVGQTGLIPLGTRSITLKAAGYLQNLEVFIGGQTVSLVPISSTSAGTVYGGDISQFAGQIEDLRIAVVSTPAIPYANLIIDDIQFSPSAIPEPSILTLFALGTVLLTWRFLRQTRHQLFMKSPTVLLLLAASSALAQGTFQNLDFEGAVYPLVPNSYGLVLASDGIPGWTPYIGGAAGNAVLYNLTTVGTAAVDVIEDLFGTNQSPLHALNGSYSVILQAGVNSGPLGTGHVAAAVEQTGLIPLGTRSITVKAASWAVVPGSLEVDVGGQTISLAAVSSTSAYTVYGGDISQFAGQTEDLRIAAVPITSIGFANWIIDDIQFSTSAIPEPSFLTLFAFGTVLLTWRFLRQPRRQLL